MPTLMSAYDRWEIEHRDCTVQPIVMDFERARFVLSKHAGHRPTCKQYVAALGHVSSILD
ncbi:hypothetical protein OH799_20515 [Nocardia sp. NBC_00881]|uniref:hypothetical protein n=1 Tax=Nocardia sp. NBC_00881 TaxID=2975995 RepID=UPI00386B6D39|nr:hypothetical protein OH799_20515 [Nocardia sp. NBC_00881]